MRQLSLLLLSLGCAHPQMPDTVIEREEAPHEGAPTAAPAAQPAPNPQERKATLERAEPAERPKVARQLAQNALRAGEGVEALRYWLIAEELSPDAPKRAEAQAQIESIVDGRLSATQVAQLLQELPGNSPAHLPLLFKRAVLLAHLGDRQAVGALEEALGQGPTSPFAPQARAALKRLSEPVPVTPGRIGLLLPKTPESFAAYGTAALQGFQLALGDKAEVLVRDTQGDPATAAAEVRKLAAEGAQLIVGPILGNEAAAAAVEAQAHGIPIVLLARTEGLTAVGPFVFRNMLTDSAQAKALAHYAMDIRGMKRFAVLYPEADYGQQMMSLFWTEVAKKGGEFRGAETYPFDSTTFKGPAEKLVGRANLELRRDWREGVTALGHRKLSAIQRKRALRQLRESLPPIVDFDGLFIADSARNVSLIAPALAVENVVTNGCDRSQLQRIEKTTGDQAATTELLGWTAWYDPDFDLVQRAGHYVQCSVFVDGFFAQSNRPEIQAFVQDFQKAYGHLPGLMEAEAYDTGRMVQQILSSRVATREGFRDAFSRLQNFPGVTGPTTIGPDREPQKPLFYLTITADGYQELDLTKVSAKLAGSGSGG